MMEESLRRFAPLANLTDEDLVGFTRTGEKISAAEGEVLLAEGEAAKGLYVLLDGELIVTKQVGSSTVTLNRLHPVTFVGEISLLTGMPPLATVRAAVQSELLFFSVSMFRKTFDSSPITRLILSTMAERLRSTEMMVQQHEKLSSLGKMAAGLAHELNNPAAASVRAAKQLREALSASQVFTLQLGQLQLPHYLAAYLQDLRQMLQTRRSEAQALDPLARSDQEDQIASWLEEQHIPDGWQLAPTLASAGLDLEQLDDLKTHFNGEHLPVVLGWLASILTVDDLLHGVEQSASRISDLVAAVKAYTYMDQSPVQDVDIHEGLENTLTILAHKLRGITVLRTYDRSLPKVPAHGSKLNQVWTNLIDNALDALNGSGELRIQTYRENDRAVVVIADNGPGIPPDVKDKIFEPFFTTKDVGKGTGLGLDIVYNIVVNEHHGEISVISEPGETRFTVCLPIHSEEETHEPAPIADQEQLPVTTTCTHRSLIQKVSPNTDGCEECLAMGDTWVHLRLCLICGHVGCCDKSKNKHAAKHYHATEHPIIRSLEPNENWTWCYIDEVYI